MSYEKADQSKPAILAVPPIYGSLKRFTDRPGQVYLKFASQEQMNGAIEKLKGLEATLVTDGILEPKTNTYRLARLPLTVEISEVTLGLIYQAQQKAEPLVMPEAITAPIEMQEKIQRQRSVMMRIHILNAFRKILDKAPTVDELEKKIKEFMGSSHYRVLLIDPQKDPHLNKSISLIEFEKICANARDCLLPQKPSALK